jgi:hypothetical protein
MSEGKIATEGVISTKYGDVAWRCPSGGAYVYLSSSASRYDATPLPPLVFRGAELRCSVRIVLEDGEWKPDRHSSYRDVTREGTFGDHATDNQRRNVLAALLEAWTAFIRSRPAILFQAETERLEGVVGSAEGNVRDARKELDKAEGEATEARRALAAHLETAPVSLDFSRS